MDLVAGRNVSWTIPPSFADTPCPGGVAARWDGVNDYGVIAAHAALTIAGSHSWFFVAKLGTEAYLPVVTMSPGGNPAPSYFDTSPNGNTGLRFGLTDGSGNPKEAADDATGLVTTGFRIVTGVRDDATDNTILYLDGKEAARNSIQSSPRSTGSGSIYLGTYNTSFPTPSFNGWMAHLAFFTRALTPDEVGRAVAAFRS